MHPDADNRAAWLQRVIDAQLSAAETTALELMLEQDVDGELALESLLRAREPASTCRDR